MLARLEIDRSVGFGILTRAWNVLALPVTLSLIGSRFTPEVQGFHFTFASLLALSVFAEMGLGTVIVQFASHEWAHLGFDPAGGITGDPAARARLAGLARIVFRWFGVASLLLTLLLVTGGGWFLRARGAGVDWSGPWTCLCLLTGVTVFLQPCWSLLEGCGQFPNVNTFRFFAGFAATIVTWAGIWTGLELWAAPAGLATGLAVGTGLLLARYSRFLLSLARPGRDDRCAVGATGAACCQPGGPGETPDRGAAGPAAQHDAGRQQGTADPAPPTPPTPPAAGGPGDASGGAPAGPALSWRDELWPVQWRIAVSWVSGYFCFSLFTPVLFRFHGAAEAGRMGMTWSLINGLTSVANIWNAPQMPRFGGMIARGEHAEVERLLGRMMRITTGVVVVGSGVLLAAVVGVNHLALPVAERLLGPGATALFLGGVVLQAVTIPISTCLRAFRTEPMMEVSVAAAVLVTLANLGLGIPHGAEGMGFGYLVVHLVIVPWVFRIRRRMMGVPAAGESR
ncbi:MAG: hypothetical protein GX442_07380 [Candidatus Riflebacteria bacterium]|nr:hypothetical protein [Candidatus Riflebacteria bacterium]